MKTLLYTVLTHQNTIRPDLQRSAQRMVTHDPRKALGCARNAWKDPLSASMTSVTILRGSIDEEMPLGAYRGNADPVVYRGIRALNGIDEKFFNGFSDLRPLAAICSNGSLAESCRSSPGKFRIVLARVGHLYQIGPEVDLIEEAVQVANAEPGEYPVLVFDENANEVTQDVRVRTGALKEF